MLAVVAALSSSSPSSFAQEEEDRNQYVMRPEVYERLSKAQEALKDNKFDQAIAELDRIMRRSRPNPYEKALSLQTLGYVYAGQNKLTKAAETLSEAHALQALPQATQNSLLYNIGQIHLAAQNYTQSVTAFDAWIAVSGKPGTDALYTVAAANYQAKKYNRATYYGEQALRSTNKPKDSLLQLLLSAYVEQKRYAPATGILKKLIERDPSRKNDWLQLSAMYAQLNKEKRALAVLQLAHEAGVLKRSDEIIQLAQRLLAEEIPHSAGRLLEQAFKQKSIPVNAETTRMLATAWYQARDMEKAPPAMERAAKLASDGELFVRLAQIHLEAERYAQAVKAGNDALSKGKLKNVGQVHVLVGIAHVRQGNNARAKRAFEKASKFKASRASAQGWLKFLSSAAARAAAQN